MADLTETKESYDPGQGKVMNGRFLGGYMFCDRSEYLIFARSLTIEGSFSQSMCQRNLVIWKHSFICSQWERKVMQIIYEGGIKGKFI